MIGAKATTANRIILPYPHPGQIAVQENARRFNWLAAGRRWRKTTLLVPLAVRCALAGKVAFWGAPTFDQVRVGWGEMRHATGGVFTFTQQRMTAEYPATGGRVIFRSMDDPDNARGHTADLVLFDETGFINPTAYYEVVRAMLMDTGGDLWAVGTPDGRNWFWREHVAAHDRDDSISWQIPTVGCKVIDGNLVRLPHPLENPEIPWSEIEQMFATLPEMTFRQEVLAEFLESEGSVFRNISACTGAVPSHPSQHQGHRIVVGVDWGKQRDYTAISVGCATCRREVEIDRFNKIDYAFQRERLSSLCRLWSADHILAERNAMGDPIVEMLQRDGLPVTGFDTTPSSKPQLIENLSLVFERSEWQFISDPIWTGELEAYERKVSSATGRSSYSAPAGSHDDTVIARALMVRAAGSASPVLSSQEQRSVWNAYDTVDDGYRWRY